jgi:prepilin-type N-terminal cleavage/methylation domain-containing protein/prepilin-type processing-associated H-X9-DG protein
MRKGFTLIELLVVIAIIAILAAILFPVFARARAKAQQNNCLSNVKQIQLGLIMYASDNNQMYPLDQVGLANGGAAAGPAWSSQILPYIKNSQIFLCPSDTVVTGSVTPPNIVANPNTVTVQSYGRNSYIAVGGNSPTCNIPLSDALITYPAEMLGVIDAVVHVIPCGTDVSGNGGSLGTAQNAIGSIVVPVTVRHNNGCNQSYMDGHVKWIAFTNIPDPALANAYCIVAGGGPVADQPSAHYWFGKD